MEIVAVVLAAGEGRRMGGRPKALLPIEGRSFLARCVWRLRRPGISAVVAVLGHEAARVEAEAGLRATGGARLVVNDRHQEGMLGSARLGLAEAERLGAEAVLLHPVDHPLVEPSTVDAVVAALVSGARIAVPTHGGRRGHPGGFAASCWPGIRDAPVDRGARSVLADHPHWVTHVPGCPGCVAGVNTPEDYERLLGPLPDIRGPWP
jgi:CTP:molybdopterin cytidylyltransferase MocA